MNRVSVALSETVREGTWALRALGYPYGVAERAVFMLAWTEAVHGEALALMREGETAMREGAARPVPIWRRDADGRRHADAGGKCLFECGPPALDLATADAGAKGLGVAVLHNVIGTRLASAIAAMAARRGLACLLVHRAGRGEVGPVLPDAWVATVPTADGPAYLTGAIGSALPACLPAALRAIEIAAPAGSLLLAVMPAAPVAMPPGATDWPERLTAAYRCGTSVDPQDYRHLYALEMQTWAPTSERSRAQAGYGKY